MSGFISNNITYNIRTDAEASAILSHFSDEYIIDMVKDNLLARTKVYHELPLPNLVNVLEYNFKNIANMYSEPNELRELEERRIRCYKQILDILCQSHNLELNTSNGIDYFSAAYYLYDFLVSNFKQYMVQFFTNYIDKEKNNIYSSFDLAELKKSKDSTTIYGKKMYKNQKLAIINANLDYVINNICVQDIPFHIIINNIYLDKNISKYIADIFIPTQDFFKTVYSQYIMVDSEFKYSCIGAIKLSIHTIATNTTI